MRFGIFFLRPMKFVDTYYFILWLFFTEDPKGLIADNPELIFITKKSNLVRYILFCGYFTENPRSLIADSPN